MIDVLRAFTVSAYAFAAGARESLLVASIEEALALRDSVPGAVVAAEVHGLPVDGIPISNSPSLVRKAELEGRTLIQRTSAGTQAVVRARHADVILAGSFVVASATARALARSGADEVTLVATGADQGHLEDAACADYIEALVEGSKPSLDELLAPLRRTERYALFAAGNQRGFPAEDLELALVADVFDFSQQVFPEDGLLKLRPIRAGG